MKTPKIPTLSETSEEYRNSTSRLNVLRSELLATQDQYRESVLGKHDDTSKLDRVSAMVAATFRPSIILPKDSATGSVCKTVYLSVPLT
jgi:hypothetical protein